MGPEGPVMMWISVQYARVTHWNRVCSSSTDRKLQKKPTNHKSQGFSLQSEKILRDRLYNAGLVSLGPTVRNFTAWIMFRLN